MWGRSGISSITTMHPYPFRTTVLKCLGIVDEYTRECLALEADSRIAAQRVIEILECTMKEYGTPQYLRSGNGPEFVAAAVQAWLAKNQVDTAYIEPGKPWQNGVNESFFDKLRDECLNLEEFAHLLEARLLLSAYRRHYNQQHPHSSLGYQTPSEVAAVERDNCQGLTFASAR